MWIRLKRYFFSGLGVFLPLALTVFLFIWVFNFTDGFFGKFIQPFFSDEFRYYFPGLSILIGVVIITLIGFVVTQYFGRRIHRLFERLLLQLPFFKQVYPAFREMARFLFAREKIAFKQVVIIEYPRKGIYSIGFLTNDAPQKACEKVGIPMVNVYIPSVPNPLTGFVYLVPREEVIFTDLTVEDTLRYLVSGGVVTSGETAEEER